MRKISFKALFVLVLSGFILNTFSQLVQNSDGKYTYYTAENDPLKARIYKLGNGLTVYLTVYKNEPRIQTYIAVKAGSKNDPADATGLAHYLEHMLFKGTDKFGSKDFSKEKPLINEVIALYEKYRGTKDEKKRKLIYHQIDSVSGLAAKYAIANEYDKMMSIIGAKGTNAFTSNEQTVYVNDIPSNEIERWLMIESERYRNPVMRLFHTELEAVYEEKNIGLDEDGNKSWEELFLNLFPTHQYGTQTTIGTIEHLKNPSIQKVINYYNTYYVPNNMAICLSGDLDPDATISLIDKYFGSKPKKEVPEFIPAREKPITKHIEKEVFGHDAEFVSMGFRFPGINSAEADMLVLIDMILSNSSVGLLDLNLNQQQKVLSSTSSAILMKDYSVHYFEGTPRQGQKLEEVKDLILGQIEKLKKGDFPDWMPHAIINNMKLDQIKSFESNRSRAGAMMNSFVRDVPWDKFITRINRLSKITKKDIVDFANKNYKDNYVVVYKRIGEDKNVVKVDKPQITPVDVNRQDQSDFLKNISGMKEENIKPVFIDYKNDLTIGSIGKDIPVLYKQNVENELFNLNFVIDYGDYNNKMLSLAAGYFDYLGTSKYTASQLKEEFYKIGCSYNISSSDDQTIISLSGLNENMDKGLALLKEVLNNLQPDKEALDNLVQGILKSRSDAKLNKETILWDALLSYGIYGQNSPYKYILSEAELKGVKPEELIMILKSLPSYSQKILYYGPSSIDESIAKINLSKPFPDGVLKTAPEPVKFSELPVNENNVYVANYDGMVQAEIIFLSTKGPYDKDMVPYISMYNEYFGSGMSGIVFQEIRESKALAYSAFSTYTTPSKKEKMHLNFSYIGTQADKLPEAMQSILELLNNMPESENTFESAKNNIIQKINTERITKGGILMNYLASQKLGLDHDIRQDVYEKVQSLTMEDVKNFQDKNVKNSKYTILVLGDKTKLDAETLSKYGKVQYLNLEDIFGY
jgi:predicted Zn-dependent peptidase